MNSKKTSTSLRSTFILEKNIEKRLATFESRIPMKMDQQKQKAEGPSTTEKYDRLFPDPAPDIVSRSEN